MSIIEDANNLVLNQPSLNPILTRLKDRSIPLNERWEAFEILCNNQILTSTKGGNVIPSGWSGYVDVLKDKNGTSLELDEIRWTSRYETILYVDMYEPLSSDAYDAYDKCTRESVDEWRETVLENGHAGFVYDW